jgi:peptide/nickel transport system permease protein
MSNLSLSTAAGLPGDTEGPAIASRPPANWIVQALSSTFARWGARIGLAWIVVVAAAAVFAPLLANSYPLIAKIDGRWSMPFIQFLTSADVTLLVCFVAAMVLWPIRVRRLVKVSIFGGVVVATIAATLFWVHPPQTQIYEHYRQAEQAGKIQWALYAPVRYSVGDHLVDQFAVGHWHPWPPSQEHWMGTNGFGSDILSHMIHACRIAMAVGFISTGISVTIGIVLGGLMGYFSGWVDLFGMRLVEIFGAVPTIYLLLTFIAAFPEYRSIYLIMAIIGLTSWTGDARFVRAEFLKLREQEFVHAAVAAGLPLHRVLFRHLLPNALAPLLVSASFGIAGAILSESTLSFLGLGIPIGDASWGQLLNEAVSAGGGFNWWLATFPGVAIFFTVLAYNLIGEALRDALDPKLQGS